MNRLIALIALITLLMPVMAEVISTENYTFSFNMTEPHRIDDNGSFAPRIKTFDGEILFVEAGSESYANLEFLEFTKKNITGIGITPCIISKWPDILRYQLTFSDFNIQSTLNITHTIDFFRDVQITKNGK